MKLLWISALVALALGEAVVAKELTKDAAEAHELSSRPDGSEEHNFEHAQLPAGDYGTSEDDGSAPLERTRRAFRPRPSRPYPIPVPPPYLRPSRRGRSVADPDEPLHQVEDTQLSAHEGATVEDDATTPLERTRRAFRPRPSRPYPIPVPPPYPRPSRRGRSVADPDEPLHQVEDTQLTAHEGATVEDDATTPLERTRRAFRPRPSRPYPIPVPPPYPRPSRRGRSVADPDEPLHQVEDTQLSAHEGATVEDDATTPLERTRRAFRPRPSRPYPIPVPPPYPRPSRHGRSVSASDDVLFENKELTDGSDY